MTTAISGADHPRLLREALHGVFSGCFLNGIYTSIVLVTTYKSVLQGGKGGRRRVLVVMIIMYLIATGMMIIGWTVRINELGVILKGELEEAFFQPFSRPGTVESISTTVAIGLNTFLADCVMIWRCWALWNHKWRIIFFPVLLAIAELIIVMILFVQLGQGNMDPFNSWVLVLVSLAFTLATTFLLTSLIIYRIISLGGLRRYRSVIEAVTESSALYSVALVIFIFRFRLPSKAPTSGLQLALPGALLCQISGISSALVIARVTFGLSRPEEAWQAPVIGSSISIRFQGPRDELSGVFATSKEYRGIEVLNLTHPDVQQPRSSVSSFENRTLNLDRTRRDENVRSSSQSPDSNA